MLTGKDSVTGGEQFHGLVSSSGASVRRCGPFCSKQTSPSSMTRVLAGRSQWPFLLAPILRGETPEKLASWVPVPVPGRIGVGNEFVSIRTQG